MNFLRKGAGKQCEIPRGEKSRRDQRGKMKLSKETP